jgi:hypothetical protein
MSDPGGPHLAAALICENVLQEQNGVISAIRIIDRVHFHSEDESRRERQVTVLVTLKSGAARGRYKVGIRIEKPSGEQGSTFEAPVFFEGEERGVNLILPTHFAPEQEGLYWFDVFFEGERITRIPLRALFEPPPRVESP